MATLPSFTPLVELHRRAILLERTQTALAVQFISFAELERSKRAASLGARVDSCLNDGDRRHAAATMHPRPTRPLRLPRESWPRSVRSVNGKEWTRSRKRYRQRRVTCDGTQAIPCLLADQTGDSYHFHAYDNEEDDMLQKIESLGPLLSVRSSNDAVPHQAHEQDSMARHPLHTP